MLTSITTQFKLYLYQTVNQVFKVPRVAGYKGPTYNLLWVRNVTEKFAFLICLIIKLYETSKEANSIRCNTFIAKTSAFNHLIINRIMLIIYTQFNKYFLYNFWNNVFLLKKIFINFYIVFLLVST